MSTIRGYRSAIAAFRMVGSFISTSPSLYNLLRALFLKRSPIGSYSPLGVLLESSLLEFLTKPVFEPLIEASLRDVTIKMGFLTVIASGQRQVLYTHSVLVFTVLGHVRWERRGVRLLFSPLYIAKNQTSYSSSDEIFIQPLSFHKSVVGR